MGIFANISVPLVLKKALDHFSSPQATSVPLMLIGYGIMWVLGQASHHTRALFTSRIDQRLTFVLGTKILSHLFTLSPSYFLNQKPGALTNIIRRAQQDVPSIVLGVFFHLVPTVVEFLFVIVLIAFLYPVVYSLLLASTLVAFFIFTFFSMKAALESRQRANEIDRNADGLITDWISNYEAIKIFGRQELATYTCEEQLKKREGAEVAFMEHFSLVHLGQAFILGLGLISLTYLVGQSVLAGELTAGDFVLFNGYILQFITPLSVLGQITQDIKKALIDMKGIIDILLTENDIKEPPSPKRLPSKPLQVEFQNVSFSHKERAILSHLSFKANPGETIVIVGPTGVGKSTIARLLLRLYDPTRGRILINQTNIKHLSFQTLADVISWVPQECYLLNDTLKNNLLFARADATSYDIESVLKLSCLVEFVRSLPVRLKTSVGNRGLKLSSGEKQRLSLARLFLKNPRIGIFDEATSCLDSDTELMIQENIHRYLPEMTKIIITHRPFMMTKADKIIALDKDGTFQETLLDNENLERKINFN